MMPVKDRTDIRYGKLVVLRRDTDRHDKIFWICQCDCGNIVSKDGNNLNSKVVRSCGCLIKEAANRRPKRVAHKQARQPVYNLIAEAHRRAKDKNLPFNIEWTDVVIPPTCPILEIPLFHGVRNACDNSPTLDRIIPELGYIKGNTRVISKRANTIKSFGTAAEHLAVARYIQEAASGI